MKDIGKFISIFILFLLATISFTFPTQALDTPQLDAFTSPSRVIEGKTFLVHVQYANNGTPVQGAYVVFDNSTYTTNSNGSVTLTAPAVNANYNFTIMVYKAGCLNDTTYIYVKNAEILFSQDIAEKELTLVSTYPNDLLWADFSINGTCDTSNLSGYVQAGDSIYDCYGVITITYNPTGQLIGLFTFPEQNVTVTFMQDVVDKKLTVTSADPYDLLWSDFSINGTCDTSNLSEYVLAGDSIYDCYGVIIITYNPTDQLIGLFTFPEQDYSPTADAGGPYTGATGHTILLNASGSYDNDGGGCCIVRYRWDFTNDGIWDSGWINSSTLSFQYTSPFTGLIRLQVEDDEGDTDEDTASVTITLNAPPTAYDDSAIAFKETDSNISILSNDVPADAPIDPSSVMIYSYPSHGQIYGISPIDGMVTYRPDVGYLGLDSFQYRVNDTDGNVSNIATVTINVIETTKIVSTVQGWNFISTPYNQSFDKTTLLIKQNNVIYTWQDAVNNEIIIGFLYGWDKNNQYYVLSNTFEPGLGYWFYSYTDCEIHTEDDILQYQNYSFLYITDLSYRWNIVGNPYDFQISTEDLLVYYNLSFYNWSSATSYNNPTYSPIIDINVFNWNRGFQFYMLTDSLIPEYANWMYAYRDCSLFYSAIPI